ncbi:MAG TPA: NAD(P)-binding protein [Steroidobacteraceae bacterium]
MTKTADELGLAQPITRRDFIGAVATSVTLLGTAGAGAAESARRGAAGAADAAATAGSELPPEPYPPLRTRLRGQYPGSFEVAHQARDGGFDGPITADDTGEHYDLVVVGAGISGLSAAHFYRKALGEDRRILVLDNHDDFGGHAKRNEFRHEGHIHLSFGGTMSIETPFPYSYTAKALLAELGVDPKSFKRYERPERTQGLGLGVFFDREHFRGDKVVAGSGDWPAFFAEAPLSAAVRADLTRLHTTRIDYLPALNPAQKAAALKRMSYQDFLLQHAGLLPASLPFFLGLGWTIRNNKRVDTCPAYIAWRSGSPGFAGMQIAGEPEVDADYFHFPDGNASIARLLVSRLVPGVFPRPQDQESIVLAPATYGNLDLAANPTRIRLNSMVVRVEHIAEPDAGTERAVRIVYVNQGKRRQLTAANVILACFNNIVPFIVPSLPLDQKQALRYASKVPMQYTSVLLRNWESLRKLGVSAIHAPNGYHTELMLDTPLVIGGYESVRDPSQPAVVQMIRNPNKPGLPRREQNRAGRAEMLATPFETIELETRSQLNRMLGPAGFEAHRDILAITVNRWPHGYAYSYDTLGDPDLPDAERPHVLGRRAFGRIAIANADSGAAAYTNVAIDQAERAVQECLLSRGLT